MKDDFELILFNFNHCSLVFCDLQLHLLNFVSFPFFIIKNTKIVSLFILPLVIY